jgi:SAM-dependent methyltransferase
MAITTEQRDETFYWDHYNDTTVGRYLFRREYAFINHYLRDVPRSSSLLEIGCGSGRLTLPLHQAGFQVVGLDRNPVALAAFKRRSGAVSLVMGDAAQLPFASNSFHCILAIQCFHYFTDPGGFLQQCYRALRNDGLLIFQSLNASSYKSAVKRLFSITEGIGPAGNLSCREVLDMTIGCGFGIQGISGYNWAPFTRNSDNALVGAAAVAEQLLRLDRYPDRSPWVLIAAKKRS